MNISRVHTNTVLCFSYSRFVCMGKYLKISEGLFKVRALQERYPISGYCARIKVSERERIEGVSRRN